MMPPRGLTAEEAAAWAKLAASVTPLAGRKRPMQPAAHPPKAISKPASMPTTAMMAKAMEKAKPAPRSLAPASQIPPPRPTESAGLDSHWERRFRAGSIAPDFTLDLHGHTLDSAHARLDAGLTQARAMGARVVLVIAGKSRPVEHADRGDRRGAIRAKLLDWLAVGPHGSSIAAIRKAHRSHGGDGALYLILKRSR